MEEQKKKNILYALIAFATFIILALGISLLFFVGNTTKIYIAISPADATYTINKKKYTGNQTIVVPPGHYNVIFKRDLFNDKNIEIIAERNKDQTIAVDLIPLSLKSSNKIKYDDLSAADKKVVDYFNEQTSDEAANAYYEELSIEEQNTIDKISEAEGDKELADLVSSYPILGSLPYYTGDYHIDISYENDDSALPFIEITLLTKGATELEGPFKQAAEDWLKTEDPNYANLQVRYVAE
ncbi:MAG: hypothetical protein WCP14_02505 [bacterium]